MGARAEGFRRQEAFDAVIGMTDAARLEASRAYTLLVVRVLLAELVHQGLLQPRTDVNAIIAAISEGLADASQRQSGSSA